MPSNFTTAGARDATFSVGDATIGTVSCATSGYEFIRAVQGALNEQRSLTATGILEQDGVVGPQMLSALFSALGYANRTLGSPYAGVLNAGVDAYKNTPGLARGAPLATSVVQGMILWLVYVSQGVMLTSPNQIQLPTDAVLPRYLTAPPRPRGTNDNPCTGSLQSPGATAGQPNTPGATSDPNDLNAFGGGGDTSAGNVFNNWGTTPVGGGTGSGTGLAQVPTGVARPLIPPTQSGVSNTFLIVAGVAVVATALIGWSLLRDQRGGGGGGRRAPARARARRRGR